VLSLTKELKSFAFGAPLIKSRNILFSMFLSFSDFGLLQQNNNTEIKSKGERSDFM
jgi:hypothetical protein